MAEGIDDALVEQDVVGVDQILQQVGAGGRRGVHPLGVFEFVAPAPAPAPPRIPSRTLKHEDSPMGLTLRAWLAFGAAMLAPLVQARG